MYGPNHERFFRRSRFGGADKGELLLLNVPLDVAAKLGGKLAAIYDPKQSRVSLRT
jgi:hypothetical protein